MWVTNWARRHTKRVIRRLVEFSLDAFGSEVELRFFDVNTQNSDKSFEYEYVLCRMSPEEAMKLGRLLQQTAASLIRTASAARKKGTQSNSWRNW